MNWIKLLISILAIAFMESHAPEKLRRNDIPGEIFELALCVLFGAWVLSKGW
jgi:hypothetical protein